MADTRSARLLTCWRKDSAPWPTIREMMFSGSRRCGLRPAGRRYAQWPVIFSTMTGVGAGMPLSAARGLVQIGAQAAPGPGSVAALAAGTSLRAAFVLRSARIARPLLDVRLHAGRAFAAASVTPFCRVEFQVIASGVGKPV